MIILTLDTEQAAIIFDAAMAAQAILNHRTARADPEGTVTKSIALQQIKVNQVLSQFSMPNRPKWSHLPGSRQQEFRTLISGFVDAVDGPDVEVFYAQIFAFYAKTRAILLDQEYDENDQPRPAKDG